MAKVERKESLYNLNEIFLHDPRVPPLTQHIELLATSNSGF